MARSGGRLCHGGPAKEALESTPSRGVHFNSERVSALQRFLLQKRYYFCRRETISAERLFLQKRDYSAEERLFLQKRDYFCRRELLLQRL